MRKTLAAAAIAAYAAVIAPRMASGQSLTDSGNPATLVVSTAIAGSEPTPAVNNSTTYRSRTMAKAGPQKITGRINTNMPAGVTLTIELEPTTGATSLGPVTLSTTTRDLLTNLTNTSFETRMITYTLTATVAAGVVPASSKTVTLTIIDWP